MGGLCDLPKCHFDFINGRDIECVTNPARCTPHITLPPSSLDWFSRNSLTYFLLSRHVSLNYFIAFGQWLRWLVRHYYHRTVAQELISFPKLSTLWSRHFKAPFKNHMKTLDQSSFCILHAAPRIILIYRYILHTYMVCL